MCVYIMYIYICVCVYVNSCKRWNKSPSPKMDPHAEPPGLHGFSGDLENFEEHLSVNMKKEEARENITKCVYIYIHMYICL